MDQMPEIVQVEAEIADTAGPNRAERRAKASDNRRRVRPRFISIKEGHEYLNCSRSYFYAEIYPKINKVKLGRRTLLELDSIDALADSLPAVG